MTTTEELRDVDTLSAPIEIMSLCHQAATEIEALQKELKEQLQDSASIAKSNLDLRRQNAELRECLKDMVICCKPYRDTDESCRKFESAYEKARKALAAQPEGGAK